MNQKTEGMVYFGCVNGGVSMQTSYYYKEETNEFFQMSQYLFSSATPQEDLLEKINDPDAIEELANHYAHFQTLCAEKAEGEVAKRDIFNKMFDRLNFTEEELASFKKDNV